MGTNMPVIPGAVSGTPAASALFAENIVKVWANVSVTPSLNDSFNMTSVADAGVGRITVTIDRDFANATWVPLVSTTTTGVNDNTAIWTSIAAGSVEIRTLEAATLTDIAFTFMGIGDH